MHLCGPAHATGYINYPTCADDPCDPDPCNGHGTCSGGVCTCSTGYAGTSCDACATGYIGYPTCADDPCAPDPCNGHGSCSGDTCTCSTGYAGAACNGCAPGYSGYPDCQPIPATPGFCQEACTADTDCYYSGQPLGAVRDESIQRCVSCLSDAECVPVLSGWWSDAACVADAGCLSSQACVELAPDEGRCVYTPDLLPCDQLLSGTVSITVPRMEGGTVTVCGFSDGVCRLDAASGLRYCLRPCTNNAQCVAQSSGWSTACASDADCTAPATYYSCVDANGAGYCAVRSSLVTCTDYGLVAVTRDRVGADGTVSVCAVPGGLDATCGGDGLCLNPCETDADCTSAGQPHCNTATGQCVCTVSSCSSVVSSPVCDSASGSCICTQDSQCAGAANSDVCVSGTCGCSNAAACTSAPSFDNTAWVCE